MPNPITLELREFISKNIDSIELLEVLVIFYFLRFWKDSGDVFFLLFSTAFFLFAVERVALSTLGNHADFHWVAYTIRLLAFLLIIAAIKGKNRTRSSV